MPPTLQPVKLKVNCRRLAWCFPSCFGTAEDERVRAELAANSDDAASTPVARMSLSPKRRRSRERLATAETQVCDGLCCSATSWRSRFAFQIALDPRMMAQLHQTLFLSIVALLSRALNVLKWDRETVDGALQQSSAQSLLQSSSLESQLLMHPHALVADTLACLEFARAGYQVCCFSLSRLH